MTNADATHTPDQVPTPPTPTELPPPPGSLVVVNRISKWFDDVVAVSDVSFTLGPGVTALLGPNGAGKSTTLRMIAGLTPPSQGTIQVLGDNPRSSAEVRGRIGLVSSRSNSSPNSEPSSSLDWRQPSTVWTIPMQLPARYSKWSNSTPTTRGP